MNSDKQVRGVTGVAISYHAFVDSKKKSGYDILKSLTPEKCDLLHMAVGAAGEAGELLDAIKKYVIYNKPLDLTNVIEELGDLNFYIQGIQNILRLSDSDILTQNSDKLSKRYKTGYSDKAAQDRADKAPSETIITAVDIDSTVYKQTSIIDGSIYEMSRTADNVPVVKYMGEA